MMMPLYMHTLYIMYMYIYLYINIYVCIHIQSCGPYRSNDLYLKPVTARAF
jgi:hypothetical protein